MRFNFRTKVFVVVLLMSFLIYFLNQMYYFFLNPLSFFRFFDFGLIVYVLIYVVALVFIFLKKPWAWLIAVVPSFWNLFNPIASPYNPIVPSGSLLSAFRYLSIGDPHSFLYGLVFSLVPLVIIVVCVFSFVAQIKKFENVIWDYILGVVLGVLVLLFPLTGWGYDVVFGYIPYILNIVKGFFYSVLFVSGIVIWHFLDLTTSKKKKEKKIIF